MDFNYTKIKIGNWLYKNCFPLYNFTYTRFKNKNDLHEIELLKQLIKPGDHVLDIGSNIGFYAKIISNLVSEKGKVYCFEPDKTNFNYLVKNTNGIANIKLFNLAVSDKEEVIKVYKSKLLNVDHRTYPVNNYDSVEEINAKSIDGMLGKDIEKIDLIKIDIQGFELTAFKGMQNLLSKQNNIKIIAEYWPHGFKRAGTSAVEFYDFFDKLNYQFKLIDEGKISLLDRNYIVKNNDKPFEFSFNVLIEKK
ncbi:MAG: FkbM family methyltransferase [Sphingobacteriaceae bacterium]|nr:FkbM family methyltransferase [Sphingobacteriaceae bacterium]